MEENEPTFVPEWLKNNGSLSTTSHQFQSSSLHSDEQNASKAIKNKSRVNISDNDLGRSSVSDRTTSSYFRRTSNSNGSSPLRSYSSFGRHSDKEKSEYRHRDYSDLLGNVLPSRFEKEGLRRSHSSISAKHNVNKSSHNNGGISTVKTAFERDFPSLGAEEKQTSPEIGRVPSPGLSSAIQSLPIGNVAVIGGDGWTSALAEVPVIVGNNGSNASVVQSVQSTCRNMAETLAQGPPRAQAAPQLSVGIQRFEELAVKQSRQLIPMTPSMPKALALNSSDKPKPKLAHSPRPISTKFDVSKTSTVGKLHVLKPSRERNSDNSSPTSVTKLPNSPLAIPSVIGSTPLTNPSTNPPVAAVVEKRPTSSQARSRNDFFNLMRKKSLTPVTPDKTGEGELVTVTEGGNDSVAVDGSGGAQKDELTCNGDADVATERCSGNCDAILYSEEEEARFLRSLGWEEASEEDEGLTEEEISSFYRDVSKYLNLQAASKIFKGTQPKQLIPLHSQMGKNSDIPSVSKLES